MVAGLALGACLGLVQPSLAAPDWKAVAQALGKSGTEMPGGVYRVGLPRSDLKVSLDGVELKPALALGSWLAFKAMGDHDVMVMGDLVLTEPEISPVMMKLIESGIEITALHNHLQRAQPQTMYMHVLGHGDPEQLAAALHSALQEGATPLSAAPASTAAAFEPIDLDTSIIDQALGHKGKVNGGVYQVSIPRAETIKDDGMEVPDAMGSAIAINFQPTGSGKAAITGDFVLVASEVNPVLKALRESGIEVTAVHNHMLDDQPRLFFMHFWANDDVGKLTKGLKLALDQVHLRTGI
ncbi:peptidase M23 [Mesorhizobium sp. SARCC-RB16n]|nr:peptidase M23 [Mesorhizobium sp. SARCC-RB16n]